MTQKILDKNSIICRVAGIIKGLVYNYYAKELYQGRYCIDGQFRSSRNSIPYKPNRSKVIDCHVGLYVTQPMFLTHSYVGSRLGLGLPVV